MSREFKYWCIESDLDACLYNIFISLNLGYEGEIIDLNENPELAYASDISFRWKCLNEGLSSLQVLQKMLLVSEYPVSLGQDVINRHEWFRITYDLLLYRFAALRDYTFQLTNSVFELNLPPLKINLKNLKKELKDYDPQIILYLDKVAESGEIIREDRNSLAHEGKFLGLEEDGLEIRKGVSIMEASNQLHKVSFSEIGTSDNSNSKEKIEEIKLYYQLKLEKMYNDFIQEGDKINNLLNEFCDILTVEFEARFLDKQ